MTPWKGKQTSELSIGKQLLRSVNQRDVLVGDAYYLNFQFLCMVKEEDADFLSIKKKKEKLVVVSRRKSNENDSIIWGKKSERRPNRFTWITEKEYEQMPSMVKLRETAIVVKQNGFRLKRLTLISTFTFIDQYSANDIADLFMKLSR